MFYTTIIYRILCNYSIILFFIILFLLLVLIELFFISYNKRYLLCIIKSITVFLFILYNIFIYKRCVLYLGRFCFTFGRL